jgi:deoxyribodipyrimidine photo-lyase
MPDPVIVWYRNDLRTADHPALDAAVRAKGVVIPLYILDNDPLAEPDSGAASRWWLHHSLVSLSRDLARLGTHLSIHQGATVDVLESLVREHGARAIHFLRRYEPRQRQLESDLERRLGDRVDVRGFDGRLLHEPHTVGNASGEPFRVFTPFWKACLRRPEPRRPILAPARIASTPVSANGRDINDLKLLPSVPDWAGGLRQSWAPGEENAHRRLESFLERAVADYGRERDLPALAGTSRLSPHLHFGEISPVQVWHAVRDRQLEAPSTHAGGESFLREIGWREFCHHLLFHWPEIPSRGFNPRFENFPWLDDDPAFRAWARGSTGYPLVDAGMRELWHTGWMHNRVRMVAASFLVKHLLVPWQRGEAWFRDTLVDADLANNACGWQWVAGCGADAAPYFRIFNPVLQGEKFDAHGAYVRKWLPELARLPDRHIYRPFDAPTDVLSSCGVRLGENYPRPIVEHAFARRRALAALATIKSPPPV